jgi:hypothetical protein
VWADGSVEDAYFFMTNLFPATHGEDNGYDHAIRHLEATLESLEYEAPIMKEEIRDKGIALKKTRR